MNEEKRKHQRVPVSIPVEYKNLSDFFVDYALDISQGGMFITTKKKIEIGEKIEVCFYLPESEDKFSATGEVVRRAQKADETTRTKKTMHGVGIKFDPLSEMSQQIINRLWKLKIKK